MSNDSRLYDAMNAIITIMPVKIFFSNMKLNVQLRLVSNYTFRQDMLDLKF